MESNEHRRAQAEQCLQFLADAFGLPLGLVQQIIPVDALRRLLAEAEEEVIERIEAQANYRRVSGQSTYPRG